LVHPIGVQAQPDPGRRGAVAVGVVLIVVGLLALLGRAISIDVFSIGWPLFVLVPGLVMFAIAVGIGGSAGIAVAIPGGIVSMVGLVLSIQAATGLWSTWAYAWALVAPGGVGLAMVVYGLLTGQRSFVRLGLPVLGVGLGLFLAFGLFFEAVIGLNGLQGRGLESVLALGLIAIGLVVLVGGVVNRRPTP
jgi:hypothetical protein